MKLKGCTNHGCAIDPPKGLGTNSMCRCLRPASKHIANKYNISLPMVESILREALEYWRKDI